MSDPTGDLSASHSGTSLAAIGERLRQVVTRAGGPGEVAQRADIPPRTLQRMMGGHNEPGILSIIAVARACGVSVEWLLTGQSPMPKMSQAQSFDAGEIVSIPKLNVLAAAGPGVQAGSIEVSWTVPVARQVLRNCGVAPDQAHFLEVAGDSMSPTLIDGATILIDRTPGQPVVNGAIYVISIDNDVRVKRVERRASGAVVLISDNRDYPPEVFQPVDAQRLVINGRVFWTEKGL